VHDLSAATRGFGDMVRPCIAVAKAMRLHLVVLPTVAAAALGRLLPHTPVRVVVYDQLRAVIWPILPMIPAALIPNAVREFASSRARLAARRSGPLRTAYIFLATLIALTAMFTSPRAHQVILARNTLFLIGLALLATAWLPASIAWTPTVVVTSTIWLLGWVDVGRPHAWAWLLQPANNNVAQIITAITASAGFGAFIKWGPNPLTRMPEQ
jgi:hypothetical protein